MCGGGPQYSTIGRPRPSRRCGTRARRGAAPPSGDRAPLRAAEHPAVQHDAARAVRADRSASAHLRRCDVETIPSRSGPMTCCSRPRTPPRCTCRSAPAASAPATCCGPARSSGGQPGVTSRSCGSRNAAELRAAAHLPERGQPRLAEDGAPAAPAPPARHQHDRLAATGARTRPRGPPGRARRAPGWAARRACTIPSGWPQGQRRRRPRCAAALQRDRARDLVVVALAAPGVAVGPGALGAGAPGAGGEGGRRRTSRRRAARGPPRAAAYGSHDPRPRAAPPGPAGPPGPGAPRPSAAP